MGRVVGLSWIFCVKRVYGFSFRMLTHTPKKSPPHSAKNPLEPRQTCRSVGFFPIHKLTQNKIPDNKSHRVFYGASNGIRLEKYCIEFGELSIHETELIEQVNKFVCM